MKARRGLSTIVVLLATGVAAFAIFRIIRVHSGAAAIPVYPGAREGGGRTRYLPHIISWDDRSSARVDRVFALPSAVPLIVIAREADPKLRRDGWYLATPDDLVRPIDPQVIIWQRDPDERLDLTRLWPVAGMTGEQRLYGGIFPERFLGSPLVIGWTWSLGGSRLPPPSSPSRPIIRWPPPPAPPSH